MSHYSYIDDQMAATLCLLASLLVLIYVKDLNAANYIRACFFNSSARFRPEGGRFNVQDIDFSLCTHYIYLSAKIDPPNQTIAAADPDVEEGNSGMYKEFNGGKKLNPKMKTLLSVGGSGNAIDASFKTLQTHDSSFMTFSLNAIQFVKQYGFNGINIHWEVTNPSTGKGALLTLLQKLKVVMTVETDMLLTITGFGLPTLVQSRYDVPHIQQIVHYVFVQCKDMFAQNTASFIGPLFYKRSNPSSFKNMNDSITYWKRSGMPSNKLVMIVTALGHYVQLADASQNEPGAAATGTAMYGTKYLLQNRLAYPEICEMLRTALRVYAPDERCAYLVKRRLWVGYMDLVGLDERIKYMKQHGLAGMAFTNIDEDDFNGTACRAGRYPLVNLMKQGLHAAANVTTPDMGTPSPRPSTSVGKATSTTHTTASSLSTTGQDIMTTTTLEQRKLKDSNDELSSILRCLLLIFLFVMGHILGYLFMRIVRHIHSRLSRN